MMTDALWLFAVLAALYLIRSAVWVDRYAVGFRPAPLRALLGGRSRGSLCVRSAARAWGNRQRALLFADILPLPAPLALTRPWPISIGPRGALGFIAQTPPGADHPEQTGHLAPPERLARATASEKRLLVDGAELACTDSMLFVRRLAALLRAVGLTEEAERERRITAAIERRFDEHAARRRWDEYEARARVTRWFSLALFAFIFGVAPLVVFTEGLGLRWRELTAGLGLLLAGTLVSYVIAHRALYPEDVLGRWSSALGMLLVPPEATRAADLLARDALVDFHPLAAARALADHDTFLEMSREFLRDLAHPVLPVGRAPSPAAREIEHGYRRRIDATARALLERADVDPGRLLAPPRRRAQDSQSYCPRCHVQFAIFPARCSDCGGLETMAFAAAADTGLDPPPSP